MTNITTQYYLCPHCGNENSLTINAADTLKEKLVCCRHCNKDIMVTTTTSLSGSINIVAFEGGEDKIAL